MPFDGEFYVKRKQRGRDNQRSAVYAWEAAVNKALYDKPDFMTVQECQAWMAPIWRAERGRYGRPGLQAPQIERPAWGQRSGLAFAGQHRITLPRWARSKWVVLHEMAHILCPFDEAHGPRFVGVLMGLLARHAGWDIDRLMETAVEHGIRFRAGSIGTVPVKSLTEKLVAALREEGPMSPMELAIWVDVRYFSVWAAVMGLVRREQARLLRGKVVLCTQEAAGPEAPEFIEDLVILDLEEQAALA